MSAVHSPPRHTMIVVTGATGNVGREVVAALAQGDVPVRAVARGIAGAALPRGVEPTVADLADPATLDGAFDGATAAFLLGGFPTLPAVLDRMAEAGVGHVVLLTSRCVVGGRADNAITAMWLESEAAVQASGIPWTCLRPSGFHSNALRWRDQLLAGDVVRSPWASAPIASIDPADIAAVAATALARPGLAGRALALSGPEPLTPGQQVAILAEVTGRPLRYEPLDDESHRRALLADGTPPEIVDAFFRFFTDGEYDDAVVVDTVAEVTGQAPRSFAAWARAQVPLLA
jgi:uncharacterized protein YbjT (DUF2867 family)